MKRGLYETLICHHGKDILPMHMPGHKRNPDFGGDRYPTSIDVTEIEGMDDLHRPGGIIKESMRRAAEIYHSEHTFFLVNGSTGGILAGIRAATKRGDTVILARNCHLSVFHALELCGLNPVFLYPLLDESADFCGSIAPYDVEAALALHPEAALIVITSPTYEGVISDVRSIANIAHEHNIPLLVDEAHGSHLGFSDCFPAGAIRSGADIVIHSLHKTLPCLTQTALMHVNGPLVSIDAVFHNLRVFQTSSPSYIFMAAMDDCVNLLRERGDALLSAHARRLHDFYRDAASLSNLFITADSPAFFERDPSKIIVSTRRASMDGPALAKALLSRHRVQCEMALPGYALFMTSLADADESYERLLLALRSVDRETRPTTKKETRFRVSSPETVMPMEIALQSAHERVPSAECAGRVCAEYVYAYPPGIPILLPGERILEGAIAENTDTISVVRDHP